VSSTEHVDGPESADGLDRWTVFFRFIGFLTVNARSEDGDPFRAFLDVAAEFAPGVKTRDLAGGRGGVLESDQKLIAPRIIRKLCNGI
jgi:hypothetical protein